MVKRKVRHKSKKFVKYQHCMSKKMKAYIKKGHKPSEAMTMSSRQCRHKMTKRKKVKR